MFLLFTCFIHLARFKRTMLIKRRASDVLCSSQKNQLEAAPLAVVVPNNFPGQSVITVTRIRYSCGWLYRPCICQTLSA